MYLIYLKLISSKSSGATQILKKFIPNLLSKNIIIASASLSYWNKIVKINNYCQFSIGDAFKFTEIVRYSSHPC